MEEILKQIIDIDGAQFRMWMYANRYDRSVYYAMIERDREGTEIKVQAENRDSPLAALQEAWAKFQNLIYAGVPRSELYPKQLEHIRATTESVANPGNPDDNI